METQEAYLSEFGEVLLYIVGGVLFVLSALIVSFLVRPNRPNAEKLSTYESGEEPVGTAWSQFNMRFYIIALIFILFEVELIFLFPWAVRYKQLGWFGVAEVAVFLAILIVGYVWAYKKDALKWY